MPIAQLGAVNISALSVPQALVQIVPPQYLFAGVSTNVCGIVGTASWGPVNTGIPFGNYAQFSSIFGPTVNRKYDLGGHVILGSAQGAGYWAGVRITDGTDVAAAITVLTNCLTLTGKYSGSLGNKAKVTIGPGTQPTSYKIIISCPGLATEIFDNVGVGLTLAPAWAAIAAAINNGSSTIRPASNIVVASAGVGVTAVPALSSYTLTGGTDGVTGITGSGATTAMLGVDTTNRTGMYALRNLGVAQFTLCDLDDVSAFSTILAFGIDIGAYPIQATPASDTLTAAATVLSTAGIDSFGIKVIFGDWILWQDTINGVPRRMSSPAAITLGLLGALSPQNNTLNKAVQGIVGTQSSLLGKSYSYSDFQTLAAARLDVICLDKTLTNNFIHRIGINTSSNPVIYGDEYPRVTYFLAKSIQIIAAQFIGLTQSPSERRQAKVALQEFFALADTNGIIGTADGSQSFQVVLDDTNNTQASVALGFQYAYCKVIYLGIVRFFIVNLEGGASVQISTSLPV